EASFVSRARERIWGNPYSMLAFASLCWSGNHIVGRAVTGHIPPLTISTIRWLVPVFIIWFVARSEIQTDWPSVRQHWGIVLWLGLTGGEPFCRPSYIRVLHNNAL